MEPGSTIQIPHLSEYPVHISLFKDVQNSAFLRQQLLAGNSEYEYGFVDATTASLTHYAKSFLVLTMASADTLGESSARSSLPGNKRHAARSTEKP